MEISENDLAATKDYLQKVAKQILNDCNRLAKSIAFHVRNAMEDFHVMYLSDEQMRELNPLIRNAIYTFLIDNERIDKKTFKEKNVICCTNYVIHNTAPFLVALGIDKGIVDEFNKIVYTALGIALCDVANGGEIMAGYEVVYVPKYWEDCVYINGLFSK